MRFLISGMPRCRTAWLTAVLRAHGAPAYHDIYARGMSLNRAKCVVDPTVALTTPQEGLTLYGGHPVLCLVADSLTDRLEALEKSYDKPIEDSAKHRFAENFTIFASHAPKVHVDELEDNDIVGEIVRICTKQAPSSDIISTFQLLRIEEHMPKARTQFASSTGPWISEEYLRTLRAIENGTVITRDGNYTIPPTQVSTISGLDTVRGKSGQETSPPSTPSTPPRGTRFPKRFPHLKISSTTS